MVALANGASRTTDSETTRSIRTAIFFVGTLTALRLLTAAYLPLSFDEAYFWLWSKHLAISYYDHPPLIALAIWLGTAIFGDTELGVRAASFTASLGASWAIWRAGAILIGSEAGGAIACSFFNATLMVTSQTLAGTPDALVLAAAAFLLFGIAKLQQSADPRWWIAVGAALGAAFLTKYTAFFLGAGVFVWFIGTQQGRIWLRSPWPYAAALIAFGCFLPNLLWNASHDWISFKFQFGRVVSGGPTIRYLLEFIGGQIALASPFIFILAVTGLFRETRAWPSTKHAAIATAMVWPAAIYFTLHAIHDRVQGNWPSFVYPALAILAAGVYVTKPKSGILGISRLLALPFAAIILIVAYGQTWTGVLPLGAKDPVARMMGVGVAPVAAEIATLAGQSHPAAIVTSNYVVTGWLSFYLHPHLPILQISEDYRWLQAPRADLDILRSPLLYVTQHPESELSLLAPHFSGIKFDKVFLRMHSGVSVDKFYVYSLSGFHGSPIGRLANAVGN